MADRASVRPLRPPPRDRRRLRGDARGQRRARDPAVGGAAVRARLRVRRARLCPLSALRRACERPAAVVGAGDRKSGVWGKSVSVRLDLGGRRNIKKKNQTTTQEMDEDTER